MKVLFVVPYLYNPSLENFQKNKTGFGIIINQMAKHIGDKCDLYIFTNVITPELKLYNATIVRHTWWTVLKNSTFRDVMNGIKEAIISETNIREKMLNIYYKINCGSLRAVISNYNPEIIHCHGVGKRLNWYYDVCKSTEIPVVKTLHGLIGVTEVSEDDRLAELDFLGKASIEQTPVSVISTGIKQRLLSPPYNLLRVDNIKVIPNGTIIIPRPPIENIYVKYQIRKDKKIVILVGSVSKVKNQIQLIKALSLMSKDVLDRLHIFIIGSISDDDPIKEEIEKYNLSEKVCLTGFVPFEKLQDYYSISSLNILASKDGEGFGLSMIEGFVYGVPCLTFSDLYAIPDIYDERAMLLCENRDDENFAVNIEKALNQQWDKEWIKEYSKRFSLEKMACQYIDFYQEAISK